MEVINSGSKTDLKTVSFRLWATAPIFIELWRAVANETGPITEP